ncbi:uncharacterized protein EI90DRAFT_654131 [Cantharellus anzutake]|uniref:uncharacterized protein n=1 Tax=Cantharellus anzutake TaxID=1750568 RepID=UPI001906BA65|nr:uncharacterized protein EI90DRAFT_654131 [Cantharellus anzutake]KAF8312751.1 hypothetical protein EI90DRAFT_654131 [Cantharellus anzutake]
MTDQKIFPEFSEAGLFIEPQTRRRLRQRSPHTITRHLECIESHEELGQMDVCSRETRWQSQSLNIVEAILGNYVRLECNVVCSRLFKLRDPLRFVGDGASGAGSCHKHQSSGGSETGVCKSPTNGQGRVRESLNNITPTMVTVHAHQGVQFECSNDTDRAQSKCRVSATIQFHNSFSGDSLLHNGAFSQAAKPIQHTAIWIRT